MRRQRLLIVCAIPALTLVAGCNKARLRGSTTHAGQSDSLSVAAPPAPPDSAARDSTVAEASTDDRESGLSAAGALMIRACDNYLSVNPKSGKAPEVLSIKAGTYYNSGLYAKSRGIYRTIIEEYPGNPFAVEAVKMVAQSFYEDKEFDKAQEWYRKLGRVAQGGGHRKEAKESRYWVRLLDPAEEPDLEEQREYFVAEAQELTNIFGAILRNSA
jgi:hypothetical protein